MGVNALAAVANQPDQQQQQQCGMLLSVGKDAAIRMWEVSAAAATRKQQQARCLAVYQGHQEAVQCVAANPAGNMCCSGGWDGQLLLWSSGVCWQEHR
jgi:WD40 repeat protein